MKLYTLCLSEEQLDMVYMAMREAQDHMESDYDWSVYNAVMEVITEAESVDV